MSERSLTVGPVIEPFAGGIIGLGLGYSLAPKKYLLKDLLVMNEDRFESIYSKDLVNNMSLREQIALQELKTGRYSYKAAGRSNFEEIKGAVINWLNEYRRVKVPDSLNNEYRTNRENLRQAIIENNYVELNQRYRTAKTNLKASPDDDIFKTALNEANIELSKAKAIIASKIELYKDSIKKLREERLTRIKDDPLGHIKVKEAYQNFLQALAKRNTLSSNRLFELANDKKFMRCYSDLCDYLPKARTKSALIGGAIFAAISGFLTLPYYRSREHKA